MDPEIVPLRVVAGDDDLLADASASPVAKEFARRYAPRLRAEIESRRDEIVAASGNFFQRRAVQAAFPVGLRLVPHGVESGADAMLDEFGGMTLVEVASRLLAHNQAKGRKSHPSLFLPNPTEDPHAPDR
jgi:hypothetical protein